MYKRLIQLQAMTEQLLQVVMHDHRSVVSRICVGLDDMLELHIGYKSCIDRP